MSHASGSYISVRALADALTAAALSTDRGPLIARLEEGRVTLFDFDGKQVSVIAAERTV